MIRRDRSRPRCELCHRYELFDHAHTMPDGERVDYIHICDECGVRSHVTGTAGGSISGDARRWWQL